MFRLRLAMKRHFCPLAAYQFQLNAFLRSRQFVFPLQPLTPDGVWFSRVMAVA